MDKLLDPNYYLYNRNNLNNNITGPSERKIRQRYCREKSLPARPFFNKQNNENTQNCYLSQQLNNNNVSLK